MCIFLTIIICMFIANQGEEIFSQGTEETITEHQQRQIDDFLEYKDTFLQQAESDKGLGHDISNQPERGNISRSGRPEIVTHTIQKGDTLWGLARVYGTDVNTIVNTNNLRNPNSLRIGQELLILTTNGVIHSVSRGESLWAISRRYNTTVDQIVWANEISNPNTLKIGQELIIPNVKPVTTKTAVVSSNKSSVKGMNFIWPVQGKISSYFGNRKGGYHYGLDIACPYGRTIKASETGKVEFVGWLKGYGSTVLLNHGDGIKTRYAHASRITVNKGESINKGQKIAEIGNSGKSTGPHLHFEIIIDGKPRNPLNYLP